MAQQLSIHVEHVAADDWVVREKGGRELGHYPSQLATAGDPPALPGRQ
jgi:hypothetical protein